MMKVSVNQPYLGNQSLQHRPRRVAWLLVPVVAVSLLSNCTSKKDAGIAAELIMGAGMQTVEKNEYERKEIIKSGGHSFLIQKHRTTGAYSIVDPNGQRHNCLGKDCLYTAAQVAGELDSTSAEGGGGGSGGGE